MELLGGLAVVGLIWYGSTQIREGSLTEGDFASFVAAAFMMYGPIKKLSRVNATIQQAMAASERIFEVLDTHSEVKERPGALPLAKLRNGIEFRAVRFCYDDRPGKNILRDVSFDVSVGQVVAIVGLSGAGKTTLVNLVPRFYDVTAGAILVDGVDIRDVTLASLRAQVGIVTQETVLFDETIASNIAYGTAGATREQIETAARAAHAHDFIVTLQAGYDTPIGERGQRLSGGQRQRLAIARALLKNSPILILDEATSSLDAESELLVQDALQNLMRNRTSFVIAHRLSTVRRADVIVVLERGRVVETGRHEELLARPGGVYAKLYSLQMFEERPGVPSTALGSAAISLMIKSMTGFASLTRDDETGDGRRDRAFGQSQVPGSAAAHPADPRAGRIAAARAGSDATSAVDASRCRSTSSSAGCRRLEVELNEAFLAALGGALDQARERGLHHRGDDARRFAQVPPGALDSRDERRAGRGRGDDCGRAWSRRSVRP